MEFNTFTLPNGIRVVHQPMKGSDVSHCGIIINTGSRDELEEEHGLAHYIEHCIFKGTKKRKAYHILSGLDAVGGELNAYTTKEETAIYASFQNQYLSKAIELITDIVFNSTFPAKEIKKEKEVIIDEIHSYLDSPSEQIFDDFEDLIFEGHPLGRGILGTVDSVRAFRQKDILNFIKRNFTTDRMVFSIIGKVSPKRLEAALTKQLGQVKSSSSALNRIAFEDYKPILEKRNPTHNQSHVMLGRASYGAEHKMRRSMFLLNNILGGPALNSRLNLGIREKYGFAYNIESSYTPYSDTGVFSIYFGTDVKYSDRTRDLVLKELKQLREKELGTRQISQARKQLIGQIALGQENRVNLMLSLGKSLLFYDKIDTLDETYKKVGAITSKELQEVAQEMFDPNGLSELVFPGS